MHRGGADSPRRLRRHNPSTRLAQHQYEMKNLVIGVLAALSLFAVSCSRQANTGLDKEVTSLGEAEVSARLIEIPGDFPANDLYNYAYVLKYRILKVHRGKVDGDEIFVAHYNPLKPRRIAQDELSGKLGGNVEKFLAGSVHRMALAGPVD